MSVHVWITGVLALCAVAALVLLARRRTGSPRPGALVHVLRLTVVGSVAGVALVATSNARASATFDIGSSTGFSIAGATYANAETAIQTAYDGGTNLGLPIAIPGLQQMATSVADFEHDDTNHSLTLQGSVTLNGNGADIQLSAVWDSATSTTPHIALAVKPTASSLQALNALWASAPVNPTLQNVLLVASPSSNYTFDASKLPTASQSFYPHPESLTVGQGLTLLADVDVSSDQNLANALHYLGEGTQISVEGTLSGSVAPLFGGATSAQEAGLDLSVSITGSSGLPSWITARTSSLHFSLSGSTPSVTLNDDVTTNINGKVNEFTGQASYNSNDFGGATVDFQYGLAGGSTLQVPFGLDGLTLSNTKLDLSMTTGGTRTFSGTLDTDATVGTTTLHLTAALSVGGGNTVDASLGIKGPVSIADAAGFAASLLGVSVDTSSLGTAVSLDSITFSFSKATDSQSFSLEASSTVRSLSADVLLSISHSTGESPKVIAGLHLADAGSNCNCITVGKLLGGTLSDLVGGLQLPAVDVYTTLGYGSGSVSVDTSTLSSLEQGFFEKIWPTLPSSIDFGPKLTLAASLTLPSSVDSAFGLSPGAQVVLNGDLGFNLDDLAGGTAPGLGATITAQLPPITANLPSWISSTGNWTLSLAVSTGGTVELGVDGSLDATVQGVDHTITVDGTVSKSGSDEDIAISGGISGTISNLFGLSWLSVSDPTVSLHLHHGGTGTSFDGALDADVTVGSVTAHVAADISTGDGTEASLTVSTTSPVDLSDVLSYFGLDVSGVSGMPSSLTLDSLEARVSVGTTTAFDLVADTTITANGHSFSSSLLLSLGKDASSKHIVVGFRPTSQVKLSDLLDSVPSGIDFTFPNFGIVLAHPATTLKQSDLLPDEATFFQAFCGDPNSPCHDSLALNDGLSIVAAVTIPNALTGVLDAAHVDPSAPALVTGTLPIFGGPSAFTLTVSLPGIPAADSVPDFIQGGALSMSITPDSLSLTGTMTFNIKKGSVSDSGVCTSLNGVWRAPRGGGDEACYDQVPFDVSATVTPGPPPSITLTGGLHNGYAWDAPLNLQWLQINKATVEFGIIGTPTPTFSFGAALGVTLAGHDVLAAMKFTVTPLEAPPFIAINPEGFRITSNEGISAQDLVDLASSATGHSLSLGGFPNIALRNIDLRYSEVTDNALCLPQGLHIAGSFYINPTSNAAVIAAGAGCPDSSAEQTNRSTQCVNDAANGCFAAIDFGIDDSGVHGSGNLGAFTVGPINFGGAQVDAELTTSVQRLLIKGGMDITGFASGNVDLLVGTDDLHFRGSVQVFGSAFDAYLDGDASINLQHLTDLTNPPSFSVKAVLKSTFLSQAGVAISGTLQALKPAIQALDVVLGDISSGNVFQAVIDVPAQIAKLGVSLPDPLGSALKTVSDELTTISNDMSSFGHVVSYGLNDILNGFDLSFPGLPGTYQPSSPTCVTDWVDGTCYSIPPACFGLLGCTDGVPGYVVQPTCLFTVVDGTCYSVPPVDFGHIPGICNDLQSLIPSLSCDSSSLLDDLVMPALRAGFKAVTGYDVGNLSLSTVLDDISNALGSGDAVSIDCAEFDASVTASASPAASVSLATDLDLFGNHYNYGVGWNFSVNTGNAGQAILDIINSILHPSTGNTCGLPSDWNSNNDFPGEVGTGPSTGNNTPPPVTPTMTLSPIGAINEGSVATLDGTVAPAPPSPDSVSVTWGDGTTSTVSTGGGGAFTATHTYTNNTPIGHPAAQYAVNAAVSGGPSASEMVTVRNVAPSNLVLTPSSASINEGDSITMGGTFTDPGTADVHTVSIDWGDGSPQSSLSLTAGVTSFTSGSHTYVDNNGTQAGYTARVTVTDDDGMSATTTRTIDVANVAPHGITVTPVAPSTLTTPEKQPVTYTVTFTDPGVNDTETARVDWGDGSGTESLSIGTARSLVIAHQWSEADTDAHPDGRFPVSVTVTDKDAGTGTGSTTEQVTNVVPNGLTLGVVAGTINEGGTIVIGGHFADASGADTHTVTVDWGTGWGATARTTTIPLAVGEFGYTASRQYGDNGQYTVTVTVTDDDGASTSTSTVVTIVNVNPTAQINRSAATSVQGAPTFLGHAGHAMTFSEESVDPGSDDLTMVWSWADGTAATSTTYLNAAPGTDPALSPQVNPRDVVDTHDHTFAAPCIYNVGLGVSDDDRGTGSDSNWVVMTDNYTTRLSSGGWKQAMGGKGYPAATLGCYLQIVDYMSGVFGPSSTTDLVKLATTRDAQAILQPSSGDAHQLLERELLVGWLDYARGVYDWNTLVDTNGDGIPDTAFNVVMNGAEQVLMDGTSTQQQLLNQRNLVDTFTGDTPA